MTIKLGKYSLILVSENKIIESSSNPGLKPLIICIMKWKEKVKNCELHDKVIGLAAAKAITHSNMIYKVITKVVSKKAKEYLKSNKIELIYDKVVNNILNKDHSNICPMEIKASKYKDDATFFKDTIEIMQLKHLVTGPYILT